jgi:hypothetical protein
MAGMETGLGTIALVREWLRKNDRELADVVGRSATENVYDLWGGVGNGSVRHFAG